MRRIDISKWNEIEANVYGIYAWYTILEYMSQCDVLFVCYSRQIQC